MVSSTLRSAVVDLVREAGRATMTYYDAPEAAGVREKDDESPVTLADEVAHGILVDGLRHLDPSTPVVSEEAAVDDFETRRSWRRFWLVDPLDGTKEFIKRRAEFTVNVALIDENVPVIVIAPHDDLYEKTVSNMEEVAARGGKIVLLTDDDGLKQNGQRAFMQIRIPQAHSFISPLLYAVPVQLLAYHAAVFRGTDVDQPRNLAKSVTVE